MHTVLMGLIGVSAPFLIYNFLLSGKLAEGTIFFFQKALRIDYEAAFKLYINTVRRYQEPIILLVIALVFLIIFQIYLKWFTRYFEEINGGLDRLLEDNSGEISLSDEMFPLERKMNTVKHTIERQKNDMLAAEKRKNDLIMYLAHDLKTPLAAVIGYLNLLCDEKQISEELREKYLAISLGKAERLEELINEFFEIAKFNLSDITLQYGKVNLTRMLQQTIYEFGPMLKEKNLDCRLEAKEEIMLKCDGDKLQRVFDNLLRNAALYSYPDTEIFVAADLQGEKAVVRFKNHGDTIPADKLERIFEQFYRLDSSRGTGGGGAGLGLAIARQIVTLHGGTIAAESKEEVTEFTVTLPIS
ncbi:MAG: HAMP domain-containing histidine kinase [Clostridium sp.]|nr:HAMP domain-containing histidine kinase [Clostridium sp.]